MSLVKPSRPITRRRSSLKVGVPPWTWSTIPRNVGQMSAQTSDSDRPRATGCRAPSNGA
jgi:hypothetical protein